MILLVQRISIPLLLLVSVGSCAEAPEPVSQTEVRHESLEHSRSRLLLLRFDPAGPVVVQSQELDTAPRQKRAVLHRDNAQYELLDAHGKVLDHGPMRIPTQVHALFAAVDGPAEGVSVPNPRPVTWVRFVQPESATIMRIMQGEKTLGEVKL